MKTPTIAINVYETERSCSAVEWRTFELFLQVLVADGVRQVADEQLVAVGQAAELGARAAPEVVRFAGARAARVAVTLVGGATGGCSGGVRSASRRSLLT